VAAAAAAFRARGPGAESFRARETKTKETHIFGHDSRPLAHWSHVFRAFRCCCYWHAPPAME
jgi:hypothetical protein